MESRAKFVLTTSSGVIAKQALYLLCWYSSAQYERGVQADLKELKKAS